MPPEAPSWWYAKKGLQPLLLAPAAFLWDLATRLRWHFTRPARSKLPVICIGNLTVGGAGKTPAAIAIAQLLIKDRIRPVFLTRGYGGASKRPHLVNLEEDGADKVGDEPLLLARVAPVIVSADRAAGAVLAEQQNADVIIMDDGFQNPTLAKDFAFVVVDRDVGVGNGWVMPSGPLRAGLQFQLKKAQALVLPGTGNAAASLIETAREKGIVALDAEIVAQEDTGWLRDKPLVAFAGIAHPEKFFATLDATGGEVVHRARFPDHHTFTAADADELLEIARKKGAQLVTTEKDFVRIQGTGSLGLLKSKARALPVALQFKDQGKVRRILARAIRNAAT
ncbi:MAG: tetraacyldisaccharide 4'-kinase [Hyphomicrobiaceae bacterium]|nr:tetraacyldisaccharide 4'-kinase [Hyphomicrobiaceae bacterium]